MDGFNEPPDCSIGFESGDARFTCTICGKQFSLRASMKQHIRTHRPRKYKCEMCGVEASNKSDLTKHERTHTGERPYICDICGEGYIQSSHLIEHARTHSGDRPNKCDLCGRGFLKKGDMLRHRRIHTGELPYLCLVCNKAFRQSAQCSNHVKNHHPEAVSKVLTNQAIKQQQKQQQESLAILKSAERSDNSSGIVYQSYEKLSEERERETKQQHESLTTTKPASNINKLPATTYHLVVERDIVRNHIPENGADTVTSLYNFVEHHSDLTSCFKNRPTEISNNKFTRQQETQEDQNYSAQIDYLVSNKICDDVVNPFATYNYLQSSHCTKSSQPGTKKSGSMVEAQRFHDIEKRRHLLSSENQSEIKELIDDTAKEASNCLDDITSSHGFLINGNSKQADDHRARVVNKLVIDKTIDEQKSYTDMTNALYYNYLVDIGGGVGSTQVKNEHIPEELRNQSVKEQYHVDTSRYSSDTSTSFEYPTDKKIYHQKEVKMSQNLHEFRQENSLTLNGFHIHKTSRQQNHKKDPMSKQQNSYKANETHMTAYDFLVDSKTNQVKNHHQKANAQSMESQNCIATLAKLSGQFDNQQTNQATLIDNKISRLVKADTTSKLFNNQIIKQQSRYLDIKPTEHSATSYNEFLVNKDSQESKTFFNNIKNNFTEEENSNQILNPSCSEVMSQIESTFDFDSSELSEFGHPLPDLNLSSFFDGSGHFDERKGSESGAYLLNAIDETSEMLLKEDLFLRDCSSSDFGFETSTDPSQFITNTVSSFIS